MRSDAGAPGRLLRLREAGGVQGWAPRDAGASPGARRGLWPVAGRLRPAPRGAPGGPLKSCPRPSG